MEIAKNNMDNNSGNTTTNNNDDNEEISVKKNLTKINLEGMNSFALMKMILQKEKDLVLAAKIGQSLLEQNNELKTR